RFGEGEQLFAHAVTAVDRVLATAASATAASATASSAALADGLTGLRARLQLGQAEHLFNLSNFPRVAALTDVAAPVLQSVGDMAGYAEALWLAGTARVRMGASDAAESLLLQSLDAFGAAGADNAAMLAHNGLGICFSNQGRYAEARAHYEAYLARARAAGYVRGMANALNNLGSNYARDGDYVQAHELYRESHALALETGEQLVIAVTLSNLGAVSRALHDYAAARDFYQRSLTITRTIGERRWTAANLNGLGLVWVDSGDDPAATALLLEGLATALAINSIPDALDALTTLAAIIARHGAPALARTLLCGVLSHARTMSSARARAQEYLDELGDADPCPPAAAAATATLADADPVLALAASAQEYCRTQMGMS
ncbi:MAG: tetratricopeptide repeat protein, partial [Caldilineaceae bacterium]|nr:tetratricopeptide repeat protein [Caldilineaceae bacterium]